MLPLAGVDVEAEVVAAAAAAPFPGLERPEGEPAFAALLEAE